MAKPYFQQLKALVDHLALHTAYTAPLEVKHLFSGAALYADGKLCVSLSPSGLAFKLPGNEAEELISAGKALPLKYFDKGHIKKGYAVFAQPDSFGDDALKAYFLKVLGSV